MSKAVLISIRPKWVEKIANGEKTIEIRKNRPKLATPFKCYIYCSAGGDKLWIRDAAWRERWMGGPISFLVNAKKCGGMNIGNGRVIGEFTCDLIYELETRSPGGSYYVKGQGQPTTNDVARQSCLTLKDMHEYLKAAKGYGWHISDLLIYDQPKGLDEFTRLRETKFGSEPVTIKRPPQSWCYVEAMKDDDYHGRNKPMVACEL